MDEYKPFKQKPHAPLRKLLADKKISLSSIARLYGRSDMWAQSFIKDPCKLTLREFYMLAGFISIPSHELLTILESTATGGGNREAMDKTIGFGE